MYTLDKTPGNYLQGLVHTDTTFDPTASNNTASTQAEQRVKDPCIGRGLTFNQLYDLYQTAKRYMPSSPVHEPILAEEVDGVFLTSNKQSSEIDYAAGKLKHVQVGRLDPRDPTGQKSLDGNEAKFE